MSASVINNNNALQQATMAAICAKMTAGKYGENGAAAGVISHGAYQHHQRSSSAANNRRENISASGNKIINQKAYRVCRQHRRRGMA